MHIELKRACLIGGKHHDAGDTTDVNERDARYLIGTGAAIEAAKKPARKRTRKAAE